MGGLPICHCNKKGENEEIDLDKDMLDNRTPNNDFSDRENGISVHNQSKRDSEYNEEAELISSNKNHNKSNSNDMKVEIHEDNKIIVSPNVVNNVNNINKNKKNNNDMPSKPPLEIINEENKTDKSFTFNNETLSATKKKKANLYNSDKKPVESIQITNNAITSNQNENTDNKQEYMDREHLMSIKSANEYNIPISSIIPENKLLTATDDDVLYQGSLKRLLNQKIGNHISQTFCDRFTICTRSVIKLYKSKEQFLKMSKPTNLVPMMIVKSVKRFYLQGNNKLHFFVIELSEINNKTDITDNSLKKKDKRRISPINSDNEGNISNNNDNYYKNDEYIILCCDNEMIANKWVVVLNYFINK